MICALSIGLSNSSSTFKVDTHEGTMSLRYITTHQYIYIYVYIYIYIYTLALFAKFFDNIYSKDPNLFDDKFQVIEKLLRSYLAGTYCIL